MLRPPRAARCSSPSASWSPGAGWYPHVTLDPHLRSSLVVLRLKVPVNSDKASDIRPCLVLVACFHTKDTTEEVGSHEDDAQNLQQPQAEKIRKGRAKTACRWPKAVPSLTEAARYIRWCCTKDCVMCVCVWGKKVNLNDRLKQGNN